MEKNILSYVSTKYILFFYFFSVKKRILKELKTYVSACENWKIGHVISNYIPTYF